MAVKHLQFENLKLTPNQSYRTLKEVGCKILALDSAGKVKMVNYRTDKCYEWRRKVEKDWSECSPGIKSEKHYRIIGCFDRFGAQVQDTSVCGPQPPKKEERKCEGEVKGTVDDPKNPPVVNPPVVVDPPVTTEYKWKYSDRSKCETKTKAIGESGEGE